jgi:hypothetical protein
LDVGCFVFAFSAQVPGGFGLGVDNAEAYGSLPGFYLEFGAVADSAMSFHVDEIAPEAGIWKLILAG